MIDKSQTCVSCMLSGAGRTEPQLGRLLLLDSTGTSGASCSALRVATSLSKYACHKTQHRITAFMQNEQTHTTTHHLVACLWKPDRCEQSVIKKHVEGNLCSPQSKEVAASTTDKHCPRVCPFIKNQYPTIQLPFLTQGNDIAQTLRSHTRFTAKSSPKIKEGQSQMSLCPEKHHLRGVPGENTDHWMQMKMEKNREWLLENWVSQTQVLCLKLSEICGMPWPTSLGTGHLWTGQREGGWEQVTVALLQPWIPWLEESK